MSNTPVRWLVALCCFALLLCGARTESAWAAKKKPAKSWPSKKKKASHKKHAPASGGAKAGAAAAPAESADDEGEESAQGEGDEQEEPAKPSKSGKADDGGKSGSRKVAKSEDEDSDDSEKSDDDDGGDATVARKKAKFNDDDDDEDGSAPVAFELAAGPRAVHRTFDFHDPLSDHQMVAKPYAYQLPAGPAPFVQVALYPAAFATRGFAANIGLVGGFEKLVATKTNGQSTVAQQFDVGARVRLPLGGSEVGLTAAYGQHQFHLAATDPGPGAGAVPNVDYKFIRVGADGRLRIANLELGLRLGTRLVSATGALGQKWFPNTKTTVFEAGLSAGYRITPLVGVVAGVDFLRYAFDFNPVPTLNPIVAGGAVDQYISGWAALRLTIGG